MMPISTRLTELIRIKHPILLAPMNLISDGRLAAIVSGAGGFEIIGGGYGDEAWLTREMDAAGDARVGVGFITWGMAKRPRLLDLVLERRPPAVMLSFGEVRPYAEKIKRAGALLICQVQTLEQAKDAVVSGADVLVAQGAEAGGRGISRGTFSFVPAVVDAVLLACHLFCPLFAYKGKPRVPDNTAGWAMRKILLATVAALGLAGTASAADLAVGAPVPVPLFSWTGCYLGINGGWIGSNDNYFTSRTGTTDRPFNINAAEQFPVRSTGVSYLLDRSFSSNQSAGTFGGQFGCQYQWGWFVLGGEWDANWSGLKEDNYFTYGPVPIPGTISAWRPRNELTHTQLDWFTTARVRLGAAWWDRVLLYATGGVAMGVLDSYQQVGFITPANPYGIPDFFGAYRQNRIGWTVGGGFEWAFAANWTAKAEFLYIDLGSFSYLSPRTSFTSGPNPTDTRAWNASVDTKEYVARVGINYLFHLGPAEAPVVARY